MSAPRKGSREESFIDCDAEDDEEQNVRISQTNSPTTTMTERTLAPADNESDWSSSIKEEDSGTTAKRQTNTDDRNDNDARRRNMSWTEEPSELSTSDASQKPANSGGSNSTNNNNSSNANRTYTKRHSPSYSQVENIGIGSFFMNIADLTHDVLQTGKNGNMTDAELMHTEGFVASLFQTKTHMRDEIKFADDGRKMNSLNSKTDRKRMERTWGERVQLSEEESFAYESKGISTGQKMRIEAIHSMKEVSAADEPELNHLKSLTSSFYARKQGVLVLSPFGTFMRKWDLKGIFALENCLFIKGIQPLSPEILENLLVNDDEGHKQTPPQIIGWERDDANKLKPRKADLSSSMDPEKLARDAVDLNLKLMRWRQAPTLDIDAISRKKVLLIGAGTLGCSVARTLLGWGVRNMTFIDDGNVSFSNPARQSLFTFEDCLDGGKPKARAAAERLKAIVPDLNTNYVQMRVPMPGHKVPESETEDVLECIETLEREIKNADAVFILTDTRESRWLPTLLCNANNVRCYNCALGFDTYLAMRHGIPMDDETNARKGCYFCNDVVAPKDSTTDRSLDQQCTVTRPGLAQIAGALAVELFITLSEEERCLTAKSSSSIFGNDDEDSSPESNAARVPHQIRGNLRAFTQQIFDAPPFDNCVACGKNVLEQYALEKSSFLFKAFNCDEYLELASGIRDLLQNFQNSKDADLFGSCSEEDEF